MQLLNAGASMFVLDYLIKQYEFNRHEQEMGKK